MYSNCVTCLEICSYVIILLCHVMTHVFAADDERIPMKITQQVVKHLLAFVAIKSLDTIGTTHAACDVNERVRADTTIQVFVATVKPVNRKAS